MPRTHLALQVFVAVLLSAAKLFTYHYVLPDDPSCGIAARAVPSFDNGPSVLADRDVVLIADENGFVGEGVYDAFVRVGWLVAVAAPLATFWLLRDGGGRIR
jgi:hypothetical protein